MLKMNVNDYHNNTHMSYFNGCEEFYVSF